MSGFGLPIQPVSVDAAAPSRYGGMLDSTDALRSTHAQAVSVSCWACPFHAGGHQSAGHPDHADGRIRGGVEPGEAGPSTSTPCGSPGTAAGGPTVAGGTDAGSFGLGTTSS